MTTDSLLDPAFVRELEALKRRLEIRARSAGAGARTARRRGGGAEFEDHRPYAPGDDLRRVDWLATARLGLPVMKTFRAEEDAVVRLLFDASGSLAWGTPPKLELARRLGAAIAYVALAGGDRVEVLAGGHGKPLLLAGTTRRGRAELASVFRELESITAGGTLDLAACIDRVVLRSPRPGLLVVLSDFLDPGPVLTALTRARAAHHQLALLHVLDRQEVEPTLEGDLELVDAESGETVEVSVDAASLAAYALRLAGLIEELRAYARRHGATYVRLVGDEPLEAAVRRLVAREID